MARQIKRQNIILEGGTPALLSTAEIAPGEAARGAGQADANTAAAEAMRDYLRDAGYETGMYYRMD